VREDQGDGKVKKKRRGLGVPILFCWGENSVWIGRLLSCTAEVLDRNEGSLAGPLVALRVAPLKNPLVC
jgi:hypothetical protein